MLIALGAFIHSARRGAQRGEKPGSREVKALRSYTSRKRIDRGFNTDWEAGGRLAPLGAWTAQHAQAQERCPQGDGGIPKPPDLPRPTRAFPGLLATVRLLGAASVL